MAQAAEVQGYLVLLVHCLDKLGGRGVDIPSDLERMLYKGCVDQNNVREAMGHHRGASRAIMVGSDGAVVIKNVSVNTQYW
jgi:hypothetical protein